MRVSGLMVNRTYTEEFKGEKKRVSQRRKAAKKKQRRFSLLFFAALRLCETAFFSFCTDVNTNLRWRKGGDSNSYVRRRQFSGLVGYQVAHPFRMERRERVERSNAGFAIQPLTVCCCGAW